MKPKHLSDLWDSPDLSILMPKQTSIRLPVLIQAKVAALCEMYPNKTRTQIINDLIASALEEFYDALKPVKGELLHGEPGYEKFEDVGIKAKFVKLTNKHLRKIEDELELGASLAMPQPIIVETEQNT